MVSISSCQPKQSVDKILINGKIYTVDSQMSIVESIAIDKGKIIAIGSSEEIQSKYQTDNLIELNSAAVYPGLWDAHCHFYGYGLSQERYANLVGTTSFDDVLEKLAEYHKVHPNQSWILGRGWDQNDWTEKEFPTKDKLDQLYPDVPVLLIRIDGHAALVNSKALALAGFTTETKIFGGDLISNADGLTGVLLDNAADSLKHMVPKPNAELIVKSLLKAQDDCFAVGLTSVMDAGLSYELIQQIDALQKGGKLKMQIDAMLESSQKNFDTYVKDGPYISNRLMVNSVKLYADGALGSRGACLLSPYSDDIHNSGLLIHNVEYFDSICNILYKAGFQVNTHAIGDSAVRMVLKTYAKYLKGENDRRWRIEHAQVVSPVDFHYFGEYSIIPAVNTTHATSDMYWAEDRLGAERIKTAYAYKQLLAENNWCTNGSDFPIESINPLFGFYAAVARMDHKGYPKDGFQIENAWTRQEALKAMTIWAAKGSFAEKDRGSIEVGKYADFVILDRDIMEVDQSEIFNTKVKATFIQGEKVF